ncbi:MAG: hypothetical protein AB8G96_15270 [Phycisphaerales bacterium]
MAAPTNRPASIRTARRLAIAAAWAGTVTLGLAAPAHAQSRVDQSASSYRDSGNPVVRDGLDEFRRRNNVVTGNVAGGRGFRGSVGYSSPFDFRGQLGSDDLFAFRADSALSSPLLLQAAGAGYNQFRFGDSVGTIDYFRSSRGASAGGVARDGQPFDQPTTLSQSDAARIGLLRRAVDGTAARSSLSAAFDVSAAPTTVGFSRSSEGELQTIGASPLQGLRPQLTISDFATLGINMASGAEGGPIQLSPLDTGSLLDDRLRGREIPSVGENFRTTYSDLVDNRVGGENSLFGATPDRREERRDADRVLRPGELDPNADPDEAELPDWQRIRQRVAERFTREARGEDGELVDPTARELEDVERQLNGLRRDLGSYLLPGDPGDETDLDGDGLPDGAPDAGDDGEGEGDGEGTDGERDWSPEELGRILRHGERIDSLVSAADRSRAGELLTAGEQMLRRGEYLRSERSFMRMLRMIPGHPTATAGLAHARLGAGLYGPASLVIRDLFSIQPEMMGARYAPALIPNRPRLLLALDAVRARVADNPDRSDNALLLAYVGRLLDDLEVVNEGLDAMEVSDPDDPLLAILQQVWLETSGGEPVRP